MSEIDLRALETNFENWRSDRVPTLNPDRAFERYCIEQILKDYNLTDDEVSAGHCGDRDDGGVDGIYFFAGNKLITQEVEVPEAASTAQLVIVQATHERGGFKETRMERFDSFVRDLLDYHTPANQISHLNGKVRSLIRNFREKYEMMLSSAHSLEVVFHYAARTTEAPNTKVNNRFKRVERFVKSQLTNAVVSWQPWGCSRLLKKVREEPEQRISIEVSRQFTTPNGDVVCLAKLTDFYAFLKGKDGRLRTGILEPNVRDYQGKRNNVNRDIRTTLEASPVREFWWLNNGITVLADECPINGNRLTLARPEIVNGLQTSHEVFSFFTEHPNRLDDKRNIIMRIIVPPDEKTGSLITKATNFQTEVKGLSLHATEEIHFDIEDKLIQHDLFYDRKKGKYKRLKKRVSQIVSVLGMARAVIAIKLRRPDDARARPQTLLARDETYLEIFNRDYDCDLYLACIQIDRCVDELLATYEGAAPDERRDIRYYLDMWLGCELTNSPNPTAWELAAKVESTKNVPMSTIERACKRVLKKFRDLGGTEQIAKGSQLSPVLQKSLNRALPKRNVAQSPSER